MGDSSTSYLRGMIACAGVAILAALAARDRVRDRQDTRRAKEYLFLLATTLAAVVYGVAHDEVTVTLSPEYFLEGKGLAEDPRPLRLAVAALALRSSWWMGLALGAAFLVANNPRRAGRPPQLSYRELGWLAAAPVVTACVGGVVGAWNAFDPFGLAPGVRALLVSGEEVPRFLLVWGVHTGSYAGAILGGAWGVGWIVIRRRRRARLEIDAPSLPPAERTVRSAVSRPP